MSGPDRVIAAVVQMTSTSDVERNFRAAEALVEHAAARGARLVGLPENVAFLRSEGQGVPEPQALDGPWVARLAALARRLSITLLGGTIPEAVPGDARVRNTSVVFGPDGRTLAVYRKIHLFDIDLPGMEHLKESRSVVPGEELVVAASPAGPLGLSICYDLRFPELFRAALARGAEVIALGACWPSVRQAHWRALLIARAIENQCAVLGVNRVGDDPPKTTLGVGLTPGLHYTGGTIAVNAKGEVLGELGDREGVLSVPLDIAAVREWRERFPAWKDAGL
jgi:predicted amidohydrolase